MTTSTQHLHIRFATDRIAIDRFAQNQRGMATIEIIPLILVFVFLLSYMLGAFGIIHTGIMHSISARAYAFETFRNRSSLAYFRDTANNATGTTYAYVPQGNRTHGVMGEKRQQNQGKEEYEPAERALRMGWPIASQHPSRNDWSIHNEIQSAEELQYGRRNSRARLEVSPVWIMVLYGICIDNRCGD